VRHMPMAPTPRPPHSSWARRARARSHSVTGLALFAASSVNSREMQSDKIRPSVGFSALPASGEPNRTGAYTRNPASHTQRQKRASVGVKPYTSWMTITPGPLAPVSRTGLVLPSRVMSRLEKSVKSEPASMLAPIQLLVGTAALDRHSRSSDSKTRGAAERCRGQTPKETLRLQKSEPRNRGNDLLHAQTAPGPVQARAL